MRSRTKENTYPQSARGTRYSHFYRDGYPHLESKSWTSLDGVTTGKVFFSETSTIKDRISTVFTPKNGKSSDFRFKVVNSGYPSNPCYHEKSGFSPSNRIELTGILDNGSRHWSDSFSCNQALFWLYIMGVSDGTNINSLLSGYVPKGTAATLPAFDWSALYSSYEEQSSSFMSSDLLLGETLAEPGIFIDTLRTLLSPRRALLSFVDNLRKQGRSFRGKSFGHVVRKVAKESSNKHLGFIFGVAPAIEDVKSILLSHQKVNRAMLTLLQNKGEFIPIRVRSSQSYEPSSVTYEPTYASIYCENTGYDTLRTIGSLARVRKDLAPNEAWKAYLQYFGIGKVVQLGWELVPFSFVVDWVTNIQERINSLTRIALGSPYSEFRNFCYSEKVTTRKNFYLSKGYIPWMNRYVDKTYIGAISSSVYTRGLEIPRTWPMFDTSGLGLFQLGASGSLLVQKLT